ncbi:nucleotidyltransferase domain-containing protein [Candidatus Woesearchaeota archaeon]|nr:nucleotidyltransferase domain-containing protein [Candidatus Woesearchaeota archaeon]
MVITNAASEIIKFFVADPTKAYNIREIAKNTGINYRLIYNAVLALEKENFLEIKNVGNIRLCSFISAGNIPLCTYAEAERTKKVLEKNVAINIIKQEIDKKTNTVYDTIIVFGSYAREKQKTESDVDILCIIPEGKKREQYEQEMHSILKILHYKIDVNVLTEKEFIDGKKEQTINIIKEVIPNHIILRGAEQFHYLLGK